MGVFGRLLALVGVLALVYFAATAYLGYRVGSAIQGIEERRVVRVGTHIVGWPVLERLAVRKSGLPAVLVESPTFWYALRRTE